ncbi:MAG: hypothetical protein HQM10_02210 [Candidatus Riflebacteria bacterium]|nr:hypothetical protein [Candidatus Riflebacteria bacterium]
MRFSLTSGKLRIVAICWGLFLFTFVFQYYSGLNVHPNSTMDASYYQVLSSQLISGKGFTEPFIWHHLKNHDSVEHPTDYWLPLGSIIIAAIEHLSGVESVIIINYLLWALLSVIIFFETSNRTGKPLFGFLSFLLFSAGGKYSYYLATTDNIAYYSLFGYIYFSSIHGKTAISPCINGIAAGAMALTRAEGLFFGVFSMIYHLIRGKIKIALIGFIVFIIFFSPWLVRNYNCFGKFLTSHEKAFFLLNYSDMFNPSAEPMINLYQQKGITPFTEKIFPALRKSFHEMFFLSMFLIFFPFYLSGIYKTRSFHFIFLQAALTFLLASLFPAQCDKGTIFHLSAAFFPFMTIYCSEGLKFLSEFSAFKKLSSIPVLLIFFLWIIFFTILGNKLSAEKNALVFTDLKPFSEVLKKSLRPPVASFDPISVYLATGLTGVVLPMPDSTGNIFQTADRFSCKSILWDQKYPWKAELISNSNYNITASFSGLIILEKK